VAKRSKKMTIVDIAAASGVSVSTVSRILNDKPDVAEETRQRVLQVIAQHRFAPQSAWQQIKAGRSRVITLHYPQDFNQPSQDIITGAAVACQEAGYALNLIAAPLTNAELLALYDRGHADGVILMEILTHDPRVDLLRDHGLPFVMIGRCADQDGLSYVDIDIHAGVAQTVEHLHHLGHRRVGLVTLTPVRAGKEYAYTTWAVQGYEEACRRHGLSPLWHASDPDADVEASVLAWLTEHPEVTALVTPQEAEAAGLLRAVQARRLRIPQDISIIGVMPDAMAELASPPVTTISFPSREMGGQAARTLVDMLAGNATSPVQLLLCAEICVRGSSGPVRAA
jgi:DNA-binding LacI/PurR family transcriptional regulator